MSVETANSECFYFHFQFQSIRDEIKLIRSNIETMKSLINEQKFHYKDKSMIKLSLNVFIILNVLFSRH